MPWVYSVSSSTPPSYTWSGLNTLNQHCAKVNIPSAGAITQLKVYAAGNGASVSTRLALWSVGGSTLAQTSTFTMASGSQSAGGQYWYTKDITAKVVSSGNYWVGLYRNPSGGHIFGTTSSGAADDGYRKTNTSAFPSISSMSGYDTHSGREPYVAAFYITAPSAQTSLSVSRNSDTSQTISWTRNSSTDQPYTKQYLYRYDNWTGSYYLKATLSGSATSYTDTTTLSDRYYKYKIRAWNAAGYSSYSNEDDINTTPSEPADVEAYREGTTIVIYWNDEAHNESGFTIQRKTSTDGTTWTSYSTLSSSIAANAEEYTDTSPANYNQYQIRSDTTTPNALHSTYSESNIVQSLVPPNPPTNLSPDNFEGIDIAGAIPITWQHNPIDGSKQTYFSIRFREYGGAWSLYINKYAREASYSNVSTASFTVGQWEYEVRTWGAATTDGSDGTGASEYSDTASFYLSTAPTATLTQPNGVDDYPYSLLTVNWDFYQAESNDQIEYICKLYDENDILLETKSASSDATSVVFLYNLENATNYKVTIQVKELTGLWSDETYVEFTTDFYVPATPTFTLETDTDKGAVNIEITNPTPEGDEVETVYNQLYRSLDDGATWVLALTDIPPNTTVTDYIPSVSGNTYYKVVAVSSIPSTAESTSDYVTMNITGRYFINNGEDYDQYINLRGDTSVVEDISIDTEIISFEGRTYPVKYQGSQINHIITFGCDLPYEDKETLDNIIVTTGNMFYRDFLGRYFLVSIFNPKFTRKDNSAYQFTCTLVRVEDGDN